ncbi:MAG: hypothetical protein V3S22_00690 [Candidatus Neomarinimicrobiota bacterium]
MPLKNNSKTMGKIRAGGWEKQFTRGEPRLSEMVDLFESIGREVRLEPAGPPENYVGEDCESCFLSCGNDQKTIWTRIKK